MSGRGDSVGRVNEVGEDRIEGSIRVDGGIDIELVSGSDSGGGASDGGVVDETLEGLADGLDHHVGLGDDNFVGARSSRVGGALPGLDGDGNVWRAESQSLIFKSTSS